MKSKDQHFAGVKEKRFRYVERQLNKKNRKGIKTEKKKKKKVEKI